MIKTKEKERVFTSMRAYEEEYFPKDDKERDTENSKDSTFIGSLLSDEFFDKVRQKLK